MDDAARCADVPGTVASPDTAAVIGREIVTDTVSVPPAVSRKAKTAVTDAEEPDAPPVSRKIARVAVMPEAAIVTPDDVADTP
jgi:hypothetical protein